MAQPRARKRKRMLVLVLVLGMGMAVVVLVPRTMRPATWLCPMLKVTAGAGLKTTRRPGVPRPSRQLTQGAAALSLVGRLRAMLLRVVSRPSIEINLTIQ
jgi:hypothetical protein